MKKNPTHIMTGRYAITGRVIISYDVKTDKVLDIFIISRYMVKKYGVYDAFKKLTSR